MTGDDSAASSSLPEKNKSKPNSSLNSVTDFYFNLKESTETSLHV